MKKAVNPVTAIAVLVVVIVVAVFLFVRAAQTKKTQFVPGVGVIDQETGRPKAPEGARRGGRGGAGAGPETETETRGRGR